MARFYLSDLYTKAQFLTALGSVDSSLCMGLTNTQLNETKSFLASAIYGYFYDDLVVYTGEDEDEVKAIFMPRLCYDIGVKLPYWYRKYIHIKKLLTDADLSLFQTSKMTSSSSDKTKTASGTLQKTATTPTGVTATGSTDGFDITISETSGVVSADVGTDGFADKYTNAQQKFANASEGLGERSGEVLREGSIDDLINVLEKLPSSFADEITKAVQKHFIFDYDGEMLGIYDN